MFTIPNKYEATYMVSNLHKMYIGNVYSYLYKYVTSTVKAALKDTTLGHRF